MMGKTRLFVLVAGSIVIGGLAIGLLAFHLGLSASALGGAPVLADLRYVPVDASFIAHADVQDLMRSEVHRAFAQRGVAPPSAGELQAQTGIDPEHDIESVLMYQAPSAGAGRSQPVVLARGHFDAVRIEGVMREHGGEVAEYKGKRLMHHGHDKSDTALAFVEPGFAFFGPTPAVQQAIDRTSTGSNITANEHVLALIRSVDAGNIWAVGRFDGIVQRDRMPKEMADRLPTITWFAASGRVDSGLQGSFRVEARDAAAAKDLRDVIQGFIGLARLQAGQSPAVTGMLNSLQLGGEDTTVSLQFSVSPEALAALGAQLPLHPPTSSGAPAQQPVH
jgi:hypothetical protein